MSDLEHLIPFRARFTPKRTDDLKPGVLALVGQVKTWEPGWVISEDDSSVPDYWGQWACFLVSEDDERHGFSWTPECDLTPIRDCVGGHEFTAPRSTLSASPAAAVPHP